jgi:hypothetical protein
MKKKKFRFTILCILILFESYSFLIGQNSNDTLRGQNLYRPGSSGMNDTLQTSDSLGVPSQSYLDSIAEVKYRHILDSIQAREIFVRDSIARRQHILDSLNEIKAQLPRLLDATLKTFSDNIILSSGPITIKGDSMLGDYISRVLPLTIDQPFTPWKNTINLSDKPIRITIDRKTKKITSLQAPGMVCSFQYTNLPTLLKILQTGVIASTPSGKVYKSPVDSVFFDAKGRVIKIKRYIQFSQVVSGYKQGAALFSHLSQVKQFDYAADNQLSGLQLVNFCDQKTAADPVKVCFMVTYAISRQGSNYLMTRRNDPANAYSDGTFTYEFDNQSILKSVSFLNFTGTENWKTFVELNDAGNVSNYIYQNKGFVNKSLLINYYLNDPKAKNKVETVSCTFEDDGVSYYQFNNTTGRSRVRDRLTMEWSDWR